MSTILNKLKDYISEERLKLYLYYTNNNIEKSINLYELNIEMSSAFNYPLEMFEVMLRNSINTILIKYYGNDWYKEDFLLEKHRITIAETIKDLEQNKKEINTNNIVSNVSFGFWVDFFHLKYVNILADKVNNVFNNNCDPNYLYRSLSKIKNNLRNRTAHRENIIKYNIMKDYYSLLIQLISLIDKDIAKYVDNKCKVKTLYLKDKEELDKFSRFCFKQRNNYKK